LRVVVVEHARLSVVLLRNADDVADHLGFNDAGFGVTARFGEETGHVAVLLFTGLLGVLLGLDGEVETGLETGVEAPVALLFSGPRLLVLVSAVEEILAPGDTTSEEVVVGETVEGGEEDTAPEDPTHLPDHPHVGFTHVVHDMEHHSCF